jgi:Family of unknown function (DUF6370)
MKSMVILLALSFSVLAGLCQREPVKRSKPDPAKKIQVVEVSCGECKLGLQGDACDLAVRIKGKAYFVDGTKIDEHGDAHSNDGFCKAIRKAEVQGEIVNDRFVVSYFKLLPSKKKKTK